MDKKMAVLMKHKMVDIVLISFICL
jgi:hypothetical protein